MRPFRTLEHVHLIKHNGRVEDGYVMLASDSAFVIFNPGTINSVRNDFLFFFMLSTTKDIPKEFFDYAANINRADPSNIFVVEGMMSWRGIIFGDNYYEISDMSFCIKDKVLAHWNGSIDYLNSRLKKMDQARCDLGDNPVQEKKKLEKEINRLRSYLPNHYEICLRKRCISQVG